MSRRLFAFAFVAIVAPSACSGKATRITDSPDGTSGDAGDAAGGTAGVTSGTGGAISTGGASTGGASTGGASTGGARTGGAGGTSAGGRSGEGGEAGDGAAGAPAGGSGGRAGSAGMAGAAGSAGSRGTVQFRTGSYGGSYDPNLQNLTVARSPSIEGQDGLLLAQVVFDPTTVSSAPSLGFELVTTATRSAPALTIHVFWKIAEGTRGQATTEPETLTITNSNGVYQDLLLIAVHGFDPSAPILTTSTANGETREATAPSISVVRSGSLGIWWKAALGSRVVTGPDFFTTVVHGQAGVNDISWRLFESAGPTGDVTGTQVSETAWVTLFAIVQPTP